MDIVRTVEERIALLDDAPIRLLLVSDDPEVKAVVRQLLSEYEDFELMFCEHDIEALHAACELTPMVILQDFQLSSLNDDVVNSSLHAKRLQLLSDYRACETTADIPLVILSSSHLDEIKSGVFQAGANDFLLKWPKSIELVTRLRYHASAYLDHLKLQAAMHAVRDSSPWDSLTGIASRYYFDQVFVRDFERARRDQQPLALLLIDIDRFKSFNEMYGHEMADQTLLRVATGLKRQLRRAVDLLARYGGEQFVLLLPNTDREGALWVGKRLHEHIGSLQIAHDGSCHDHHLTVSIGVSSIIPARDDHTKVLLDAVYYALCVSKEQGGDQVRISVSPE